MMVKLHCPCNNGNRTLFIRQHCVKNPFHWGPLPSAYRIFFQKHEENHSSYFCVLGFFASFFELRYTFSAETTFVVLMATVKLLILAVRTAVCQSM